MGDFKVARRKCGRIFIFYFWPASARVWVWKCATMWLDRPPATQQQDPGGPSSGVAQQADIVARRLYELHSIEMTRMREVKKKRDF